MKELEKVFNPSAIEKRIYDTWMANGYFHAEKRTGKPYTIVIPPPNVTGVLHMGHGLNNTLQDILIRYKRMDGFDALWMPGTDHAGIATQNVVEKKLKAEGKTKHDLGREKFVERTWQVKEEHHAVITEQLKKIGCSPDWVRERFTLDEGLSDAVKEVFVSMFKEGLIYRGKYIINYCPRCGTALANDEVEYEDKDGGLWHIKYQFKGSDEFLVVATTRPETMLGDTAVAINPDDERYANVPSDTLILPLVGRELKLIRDSYVEMGFGTGALKVTPAHDPNDFMLAEKHNLEKINILAPDGTINDNAPAAYRGLDRFEARKRIAADLQAQGILVKRENHRHQVGHCYRCHDVVEPYYSDQWFVKMAPLAEKALAAVRDGRITIYPERWVGVYEHWLTGIKDWCISRQLWWGHRIPVWYCDCGEIICEKEAPKQCPKCGGTKLRQDEDVLDTWFSSWLWPFSTLGWPNKNADLSYFYPTSVLITGFDILFFWVARMIMAGLHFMKEIPFKDVYLHGLVRDKQGRKMSKSLGNGIDPIEIINEHGADAFRFTLAFLTSLGQDVLLDKELFKIGFKFANKLWNSTRFIFSYITDSYRPNGDFDEKGRWIISRLQDAVKNMRAGLDAYRFDEAAQAMYQFYWNDFCDWYLELSKKDLKSSDADAKNATLTVLLTVLRESLKALHPIMPFITEEIWQSLPEHSTTIMLEAMPAFDASKKNASAEKVFSLMQDIVQAIRNAKASFTIPREKLVTVTLTYKDALWKTVFDTYGADIGSFAIAEISLSADGKRPDGAFVKVLNGGAVNVHLAGIIDVAAEGTRLKKELDKLTGDLAAVERKLSNENFTAKAKPEAVETERRKQKEFSEKIASIKDTLSAL